MPCAKKFSERCLRRATPTLEIFETGARYQMYHALALSLYWIRDDPTFSNSVIIASEPLFIGNWNAFPENSIITVRADCEIQIEKI
jgi:predicted glutamine amidotransferase